MSGHSRITLELVKVLELVAADHRSIIAFLNLKPLTLIISVAGAFLAAGLPIIITDQDLTEWKAS